MTSKSNGQYLTRFGIGEWYGKSFAHMTGEERRTLSNIALRHRGKISAPRCPFKNPEGTDACTKNGGVCSLRLYQDAGDGTANIVEGPAGDLRTVCPHRFKQNDTIYERVGLTILGRRQIWSVNEVRFLQRVTAESEGDETTREDVGNIDDVLVDPTDRSNWCALEIQSVYFSGKAMSGLFNHIRLFPGEKIPFPDAVRRPDYRSSGPKRLMPQLQIKVPTLRRWGKKMAVVVDEAFYRNLGAMDTVSDLSNCDIAWFVVRYDESVLPAKIQIDEPNKQTLERAVEGLTGGTPVTREEFEQKIALKLKEKYGT